jgi:hypothetical protein
MQANRTVFLSLEFFPPLQETPFRFNVSLGGLMPEEQPSLIGIINIRFVTLSNFE